MDLSANDLNVGTAVDSIDVCIVDTSGTSKCTVTQLTSFRVGASVGGFPGTYILQPSIEQSKFMILVD
jgi:hypothetical protein